MKRLFPLALLLIGMFATSACTSDGLVGVDQDSTSFTDVRLSSSGDGDEFDDDWTPPSDGNCPVYKSACLPPGTPTNDDLDPDPIPIDENPWDVQIDFPYGCPAYKQHC